MADTKISALAEATSLTGTEDFPLVQTTTKRCGIDTLFSTSNALWQGWTFLTTPLTSTSYDGDAHSTASAAVIDLSTVFGVPAGVSAVLVRLEANDSAAWGTADLYVSVGPSNTYYYQVTCRTFGGDIKTNASGVCNCDASGDIYIRYIASGTNTLDVRLEIWGYCEG